MKPVAGRHEMVPGEFIIPKPREPNGSYTREELAIFSVLYEEPSYIVHIESGEL